MRFNFKHYTEAIDTIRELKRQNQYKELEELLKWCVEDTEKESVREGWGVAPFYYDELAKLYRKEKNYRAEVRILERFAHQVHASGSMPPKLIQRLDKARQLCLKKAEGNS